MLIQPGHPNLDTIRMSDYGLKPPTAALGTIGTKDLMTVSFQITATQ